MDLKSMLMLEDLPARRPLPGAEKAVSRIPGQLPTQLQVPVAAPPPPSPQFNSLLPSLLALKAEVVEDLSSHLPKLLTLNPSRRESIVHYLSRLSCLSRSAGSQAGAISQWLDAPHGSPFRRGLDAYLEEIALVFLGQVLLLKGWSDRGLRKWSVEDISRLNWALSTALKPHVPLDREGWQITRPNLYTWYAPSPAVQKSLANWLSRFRFSDEGPQLLLGLLQQARECATESAEKRGYDARFVESLWARSADLGFDHEGGPGRDPRSFRRKPFGFCPTLRDGAVVRTGPSSLHWVGLESSPFLLTLAELAQLWWGPTSPPLWAQGSGLEVHPRDQLSFAIVSPKPSLFSKIAEIESCDIAFVLEELPVRLGARSIDSESLRAQLASLPYFKKLQSSSSSLGALQACVALAKLRPGGILWWAREEPLSPHDGKEVLDFLLERSRLLCEWDLARLEHALPVAVPPFARYLYAFAREANVEARLNHRPIRVSVEGSIRSHVELPLVLEDCLRSGALSGPSEVPGSRGHWRIRAQRSPIPQRDWMERWPELSSHASAAALERLESSSVRLGNAITIRQAAGSAGGAHPALVGFWLSAGATGDQRRLVVEPFARRSPEPKPDARPERAFLGILPDESWIAPLAEYLRSDAVASWLDSHSERKGDRWALSEQLLKWIPVPKALAGAIQGSTEGALPLPGPWEKLASEIMHSPLKAIDSLKSLEREGAGEARPEAHGAIHAAFFVRCARALQKTASEEAQLRMFIEDDGRVVWREILKLIPAPDRIAVAYHPRIRMQGSIPPHLPIGRIQRIRTPEAGLAFATESGLSLQIHSDQSLLIEILWDQARELMHPTWHELVDYLRVPRRLEVAETLASDMLRAHGEVLARARDLRDLISACTLY